MMCAWAHWFGISSRASAVLTELYLASPDPLSRDDLALRTRCTPATIARLFLPLLRQVMVDDAIDHIPGSGYLLTEDGAAECRRVLMTMSDELRAAV